MRQSIAATLLLLAAIGTATASDLHPIDLRVSVMLAPKTDAVEMNYYVNNSGVSLTSDSIDAGLRFEAGLVTRLVALSDSWSVVGGASFFYSDQETEEVEPGDREFPDATGPMEYTTMGVDLYVAINLQLSRHVELECGPFVGVGTARFADRAVEAGNPDGRVSQSGSGDYEEAGLNFALLLRNISHSVVASLGVKYLVANGEADLSWYIDDGNGNSVSAFKQDVEIHTSGFAPYLTIGMTF